MVAAWGGAGGRAAAGVEATSRKGGRAVSSYGREIGGAAGADLGTGGEGAGLGRAKTAMVGGEGRGGWGGELRESGEEEWKRVTQGIVGVDAGRGKTELLDEKRKWQEKSGAGSSSTPATQKGAPSPVRGGVRFAEVTGSTGTGRTQAGGPLQGQGAEGEVEAGAGGEGKLPGYKVGLGGVAMDVGLDGSSSADDEKRLQKYMALRKRKEEEARRKESEARMREQGDVQQRRVIAGALGGGDAGVESAGAGGGGLSGTTAAGAGAGMRGVGGVGSKRAGAAGALAARHSNRKIIRNAISHVCLVAPVQTKKREAVLQAMDAADSSAATFVIVLVREPSLKFKGLYAMDLSAQNGEMLPGTGTASLPKLLSVEMVREFLKYDSGTKSFRLLDSKSFSISTDAVVLHPQRQPSAAVSRLY